jgi:hypothetical protein
MPRARPGPSHTAAAKPAAEPHLASMRRQAGVRRAGQEVCCVQLCSICCNFPTSNPPEFIRGEDGLVPRAYGSLLEVLRTLPWRLAGGGLHKRRLPTRDSQRPMKQEAGHREVPEVLRLGWRLASRPPAFLAVGRLCFLLRHHCRPSPPVRQVSGRMWPWHALPGPLPFGGACVSSADKNAVAPK